MVEGYGFAIIPDVLESEKIATLLESFVDLNLPRSRAGVRHLLGIDCVAHIANDLRCLEFARGILGGDAYPFRATLFDKSPEANWLITWHQDTALPLKDKREAPGWGPWSVKDGITYAHAPAEALEHVLAIRLHLDDSTEENGPLRVVPGSHLHGVLSDQQVEASVANSKTVTCLVPRGGVILMRPLIIHASSKSRSHVPRRVLHIEYASHNAVSAPLELAIA